jgi:hypothetical protein
MSCLSSFIVTQLPRHKYTLAQVLILVEDALDMKLISPTGEKCVPVCCLNLLEGVLTLVFVKVAQQLYCQGTILEEASQAVIEFDPVFGLHCWVTPLQCNPMKASCIAEPVLNHTEKITVQCTA